jgi:hypothetical protein
VVTAPRTTRTSAPAGRPEVSGIQPPSRFTARPSFPAAAKSRDDAWSRPPAKSRENSWTVRIPAPSGRKVAASRRKTPPVDWAAKTGAEPASALTAVGDVRPSLESANGRAAVREKSESVVATQRLDPRKRMALTDELTGRPGVESTVQPPAL